MSDRKISELTNITGANLVDADEFVVVDISADETKAITFGELKEAFDTGSGFVRITGDTMTGDLTVPNVITSGNVDGRDVSADGTKLDTIETNADVTDTTNVTAAGALMTSGGTMTGDVAYGDNVKATFGASADLQVYHDGSTSYIYEQGTGDLRIRGNEVRIEDGDGSTIALFQNNAGAQLRHNGTTVLNTNATGVDVTGTVVADGLTVDGTTQLDSGATDEVLRLEGTGSPYMSWYDSGVRQAYIGSFGNTFDIVGDTPDTQVKISTGGVNRASFDSTGIDVTGTVSADGLVIEDGGSPTNSLDITYSGSSGQANIQADSDSGNAFLTLGTSQSGTVAERMRIDSSGNVGIGTTTPTSPLYVEGTIQSRLGASGVQIYGTGGSGEVASVGSLPLVFNVNSSAKMSILSSGNVGIGTTSPNSLLYLYGDPQATSGAVATIRDSSATSSNTSFASILFSSSPGTDYSIGKSNVNATSTLSFRNANTGTSYVDIDSSGNLEMTGGGSVGWANFTFKEESGYLYVYNGSTKIMRVDASGNAAFAGDVEANATL